MQINSYLQSLYANDHKLNSFASKALAVIEGHIQSNPMIFFPEYTDHGISHLELTLQTAFDLSNSDSKSQFTPHDAVVLTLAVAMHDLGMYLSRDGFESLISPNSKWTGVPFFDKRSWSDLWENFLSEATRFDGRKLKSLFGENYRPIKPPPKKDEPWEEFDFLLVGEFLRRNHPRLAHEIALYGLPAKGGNSITICSVENDDQRFLADISGLVARSHGMDLRPCADYLEKKISEQD